MNTLAYSNTTKDTPNVSIDTRAREPLLNGKA